MVAKKKTAKGKSVKHTKRQTKKPVKVETEKTHQIVTTHHTVDPANQVQVNAMTIQLLDQINRNIVELQKLLAISLGKEVTEEKKEK